MYPLHIQSEIGQLTSVLVHRPGREIERVTPEAMKQLLFDDIPYLPAMQKEHDAFVQVLRNEGAHVFYVEDLLKDVFAAPEMRRQFLDEVLKESHLTAESTADSLREYLLAKSAPEFVESMIAGVRKEELPPQKRKHLHEMMERHYPFYLDPMPNAYFTRDAAAVIGRGLSINPMSQTARKRESMFSDYVFTYHPKFDSADVPRFMTRDYTFPIEGGDQLVLSDTVLAVGVSERTSAHAVEELARRMFAEGETIEKIIAVEIPKKRSSMHLDTVFTMVSHDQFTTHAEVVDKDGTMPIFLLERGDPIRIQRRDSLRTALMETLNLPEVQLIPCGGEDRIASAREQWNDGSNTLATAPGRVITYERNYVSNELLRENGITVLEVPSSELVRGRGGPRCMSMPLSRET
ncbi:arginine deiminase [Alkalicoccus urumqiensis]|uniref:Arginine deiminase n=1 Tax=Alkalicoccus urumqiensis TaxID=1548213 RepID=A0A2P6MID2_ALKUR|nr:arginine deiminase [Alkalicoccus urumqiensis]PRO66055.1 arginine deiminase [Alkalicoccus urumqiensis]